MLSSSVEEEDLQSVLLASSELASEVIASASESERRRGLSLLLLLMLLLGPEIKSLLSVFGTVMSSATLFF